MAQLTKEQRRKLIIIVVLTDLLVVGAFLYQYILRKP